MVYVLAGNELEAQLASAIAAHAESSRALVDLNAAESEADEAAKREQASRVAYKTVVAELEEARQRAETD